MNENLKIPYSPVLSEEIIKELAIKNENKIILIVLDGVGGLPYKMGKTELEYANTPNLDKLAKNSALGLTYPVAIGITPGSGPSHLSLFGYDPVKYNIGRGILEALGLGLELTQDDLPARANFATLKDGIIVDRRAGRIPTEKNQELCEKLSKNIKKIEDVEVIIKPGKEHRFVVVFRGKGLESGVSDADPQKEGLKIKYAQALKKEAEKSARIVNKFIDLVTDLLKNEEKANTCLLRGIDKVPPIPKMSEIFKLNPCAIATYPMYKGLAKLVGMEVLEAGETLSDQVNTLKKYYNNFDFFYFHIKKTDSYGEDGNFDEKVKIIEEFDKILPEILSLDPSVVVITGDHSTPSILKGHSWHPNPFLLYSKYVFTTDSSRFTEKECLKGSLGQFYSINAMPLMLANSLKLKKFGA